MTESLFEIFCERCNVLFIADVHWKTHCKKCYAKKMKAEQGESSTENIKPQIIYIDKPIELEMLNRLIRLCHPDKHDNSKASNEVTAWLLDQRKTAKESC